MKPYAIIQSDRIVPHMTQQAERFARKYIGRDLRNLTADESEKIMQHGAMNLLSRKQSLLMEHLFQRTLALRYHQAKAPSETRSKRKLSRPWVFREP